MRSTPRTTMVALVAALAFAACGDSDDSSDDTTPPTEAAVETSPATDPPAGTEAPAETDAPTETEAPVETAAPAETDAVPEAPAPTDAPAASEPPTETAPPASGVDVTLVEWAIEAPTEYAAGEITFSAINGGNFPHELVVVAGESYESLPLADNGAVLEDALPTGALIGRTARIGSGEGEALTVELTPGNFVLLCNIAVGPNSHAGAGQRLDITVS